MSILKSILSGSYRLIICKLLFPVLLVFLFGVLPAVASNEVRTDPHFGLDGFRALPTTTIEHVFTPAQAFQWVPQTNQISVSPDGEIFAPGRHRRGRHTAGSENLGGIIKFKSDGRLDTNFGSAGRAEIRSPFGETFFVNGSALRSDGKLVVSGWFYEFNQNGQTDNFFHGVTRLLPDGRIDTSFGDDGFTVIAGTGQEISPDYYPRIDLNDRIYLFGTRFTNSGFDNARIRRLSADGTIDSNWGNNGVFDRSWPASNITRLHGAGFDSQNRLYFMAGNTGGVIVRLTEGGVQDASFAGDGVISPGGRSPRDLQIIDDRVVSLWLNGSDQQEIRVYDLDGQLDSSQFGNGLHSFKDGDSQGVMPTSVTRIDGGDYLVSAWHQTGPSQGTVAPAGQWRISRVQPDGTVSRWDTGPMGTRVLLNGNTREGNFGSLRVLGSGNAQRVLSYQSVLSTNFPNDVLNTNHLNLARRTLDGSLDSGFGQAGVREIGWRAPLLDTPIEVLAGPAGSTVVVSHAHYRSPPLQNNFSAANDANFLVVSRFRADGSADPSWAGGESARVPLRGESAPRAAAIGPNGEVLVVNADNSLVRFTPYGSLDTTFGGDGRFQSSEASDGLLGVVVDPDSGDIRALGISLYGAQNNPNSRLVIIGLDPQGQAAPGFGSNGRLLTDMPAALAFNSGELRYHAVPLGNGEFIMGLPQGGIGTDIPREYNLRRIRADGSLNTSFGVDGKLTLMTTTLRTLRLDIDEQNRVVATTSGVNNPDVEVFYLDAQGQPVAGFGTAGLSVVDASHPFRQPTAEPHLRTQLVRPHIQGDRIYLSGNTLYEFANINNSFYWVYTPFVTAIDRATGSPIEDFAPANNLFLLPSWREADGGRLVRVDGVRPTQDPGRLMLYGHDQAQLTQMRLIVGDTLPNQPPVINEGGEISVVMDQNGSPQPFDLTLTASDPEGSPLQWSVLSLPNDGQVSIETVPGGGSAHIDYSPRLNYSGSDQFWIQVSDGFLTAATRVDVQIARAENDWAGDGELGLMIGDVLVSGSSAAVGGFGGVVNGPLLSIPVTLSNTGTGILVFDQPLISNQNQVVVNPGVSGLFPEALAPGASQTVALPLSLLSEGAWSLDLTIRSEDPDRPLVEVAISGQAAAIGTPLVSMNATTPVALADGSVSGLIEVRRTGPTGSTLTVELDWSGSAIAGVHYQALPSSVTFPAGESRLELEVQPIADPGAVEDRIVRGEVIESLSYGLDAISAAAVLITTEGTTSDRVFGDRFQQP